MQKYISECKCGANDFRLVETVVYWMKLDDGTLYDDGGSESTIDEIECNNCGKRFDYKNFEDVNLA